MRHLIRALRTLCAILALSFFFGLPAHPVFAQETTVESDTLTTLLDTLRDDDARAALIAELETLADTQEEEQSIVEEILTDTDDSISLGRRIALYTQDLVEATASRATRAWDGLTNNENVFAGLNGSEFQVLLTRRAPKTDFGHRDHHCRVHSPAQIRDPDLSADGPSG